MTIDNLEKELKQGKLNSIYLLYGEEMFLLENSLKKIKNLFGELIKGINYINIDEQNISGIISDIETPSFGYEKKLIIARNTGLFSTAGKRKNAEVENLKENLITYIEENIEMINEAVVIVFVEEEVDSRLKIFKQFDKFGTVCKFDFQKPAQIQDRMKAICNAYKVNIEPYTLNYFIEQCGTNMQELINEIRKLIEYAGENGTIQKEDIDKLCTKKIESVIFDLTDNLGKKNIAQALDVLNELIYQKEPLQRILIMLYNHFKKLYITKVSLQNNKNLNDSLKLKPNQSFLVNKYNFQAKYFALKDLRNILQDLCDLDYNSKIGLIDLQVGVETILCKYCA